MPPGPLLGVLLGQARQLAEGFGARRSVRLLTALAKLAFLVEGDSNQGEGVCG